MGHITFSIVIPAHNGERFLRSAIESVLNQTRPADEIIVVDDASKDGTTDVAHSAEFSGRIRYYFNEQSSGFVDAWNRAISKAMGDFVTILHQDDLLYPEYLEHMENAVRQYPQVRHLYSTCTYIDENDRITVMPPEPYSPEPVLYSGKQYAHNYLRGVIFNQHIHRCPGVLTSRQLLIKDCTYRKEAGHIADDDFFYRVGRYTDVAGISLPLASFRVHAASETAKTDLIGQLAADYIYQTRQTKSDDCIFDESDKQLIFQAAVKFINEQLFYKLLNNDRAGVAQALDNAYKLEAISPEAIKPSLPVWAKIMWIMTEKSLIRLSCLYVLLLNAIRHLRDYIRRGPGGNVR